MERRWLYAGLAVAAGVGLTTLIRRGPKITAGQTRLLLIGDSLAVGLGPQLQAIAKDQKVPFDAVAEVGTRIDQWATRADLDQHLAAFKPTLVLVSLGTNDAYMQGDWVVGRQQAALQALLAKIKASGAEAVWIGPPTLPLKTSNGIVPMLKATIPSSHYFPSDTALQLPRGPDGIHPTVAGYAGWAGALWQWLS